MEISALVCKDIVLSRFVPKDEKSQSVPTEILGLYNGFTMTCGNFQVPKRRVQGLKQLIDTMIKKHFTVSARCLSYLTGSLVSVGLALDPLVRLWTWSIYNDICSASSEPLFWKDNVDCTWSENVDEGVLSRFHDANDYMIDPSYFQYIDEPWGPHKQTKQLNRYCSRYGSLGCEAADAFTVTWSKENNWLFHPPFLIPLVLRHMSAGGADGTLIPQWPSTAWCSLLVQMTGSWKAFVTTSMIIQPCEWIFLSVAALCYIFTSGIPSFPIMVLCISFSKWYWLGEFLERG